MVRLCGAALGLLAFAATIFLGVFAGNSFEMTVLRAIRALVIFCVLGFAVGWVARRVLDEHALRRDREISGVAGDEDRPADQSAADEAEASSPGSTAAEREETAKVAADN